MLLPFDMSSSILSFVIWFVALLHSFRGIGYCVEVQKLRGPRGLSVLCCLNVVGNLSTS